MFPVTDMRAKLLLRPQADVENGNKRNRNRPEGPEVEGANCLPLTVGIEHPVSHVKVRNARRGGGFVMNYFYVIQFNQRRYAWQHNLVVFCVDYDVG